MKNTSIIKYHTSLFTARAHN